MPNINTVFVEHLSNKFISFLIGRTQQVRIGESYSLSAQVVFGIIKDSVVGSGLHKILIDSLLHAIRLPSAVYTDEIKFIADVTLYSIAEVQAENDIVMQ